MPKLPIQSPPVQRSRLTRGPERSSPVAVSPSVCVQGLGCIGPFLSEGGVTQSICVGPVCVGPFAD